MSTQDNRILDKARGKYPFKVSDKYFDNLTARIMEQIPDESVDISKPLSPTETNSRRSIRWWLQGGSIAASLILIATVSLRLFNKEEAPDTPPMANIEYTSTDDYNEALMTYSMTDNFDVYYYLEGEEEE